MASLEPVLHVEENRFVLFPIRYPTVRVPRYGSIQCTDCSQLWEAYKEAQRSFWTTEEVDFTGDLSDWTDALTDAERSLLSVVLAFFAASDGIVAENLVQQFCAEVQGP